MRTLTTQQLEVDTRRSGVEFRNRSTDGPHLLIWGVGWQLPSRATVAKPKFVDGKPTFDEAVDEFPAADDMIASLPEVNVSTCSECGSQRTKFDLLEQSEWLSLALTSAVEALSSKYDLNDEQLGDLLAITPDSATWVVQLSQWAAGNDTVMPAPHIPDMSSWLDDVNGLDEPADDLPPVIRKPWIKRIFNRG